jgi:hypothetical protein
VGHGIAPLSARAATILNMMSTNTKINKVPNRAQEDRGGKSDEPKTDDKTKTKTMTEDITILKPMTYCKERNTGKSSN